MPNQPSDTTSLEHYNIHDFDVPLTTVDMSIFTLREGQIQVLLVKRAQRPHQGEWALPGGFIDLKKDNNLLDTARRKLHEKTGIDTPYLEQVATFGSADRDPRGWSVTIAYFALINSEGVDLKGNKSTEEVIWAPIRTIFSDYALAFDHKAILSTCVERLQSKVHYTALPTHLLPASFTLSELQTTFELILEKPIEKKSFRRRILEADMLEETGKMKEGNNRPAKLYCVKQNHQNHYFSRNIEGSR